MLVGNDKCNFNKPIHFAHLKFHFILGEGVMNTMLTTALSLKLL